MLTRQCALAIILCLTAASLGSGQTPTSASPERIDALVRKLGSASFPQREHARKELEAIGTPALDSLRHAKRTSDAETNRRIDELIHLFEEQLLTRQILTPKQIHLKLDDLSVKHGIADLANLSGYPIQLHEDASTLADKKIKLDTGKTSFWQALDQLCEQAGLMEQIDLTTPPPVQLDIRGKGGKRRFDFVTPSSAIAPVPIVLVARGKEKSLVSYAGSVKTEMRISREAVGKALNLLFVVSTEPSLLNYHVVGRPVIDKALDHQGRHVNMASSESPRVRQGGPNERFVPKDGVVAEAELNRRCTQIRLNDGTQAAKQLQELAGKLTLQLDLQNDNLARIDKILDAAGKSAGGANGGTLKLRSVKKLAGGDIEIQVSLENLARDPFGGNVAINRMGGVVIRGNMNARIVIGPNGIMQFNGAGNPIDLPDLLDSKGQKYKVGSITSDSFHFLNGTTSRTATVVYQANAGQAEPSSLVLFGTRTHTIAVPFRFADLPLP
jgi:hypothetical protein